MVRTRRYKYILNEGPSGGEGAIDELYDLQADPGELVNLVDRPELQTVQRELREQLLAWS